MSFLSKCSRRVWIPTLLFIMLVLGASLVQAGISYGPAPGQPTTVTLKPPGPGGGGTTTGDPDELEINNRPVPAKAMAPAPTGDANQGKPSMPSERRIFTEILLFLSWHRVYWF